MDADVWSKWVKWIAVIENDLATLVDDHAVFDVFQDVVEQNGPWITENEGGAFVDLVRRSFVASAFMTVRRHVKAEDKDAISLLRLLSEMAAQAHQITYDFYLSVHPVNSDDNWIWVRQPGTFGKLSEDGLVVFPGILRKDIVEAERLSGKIEEIADRQIAHLDPRGTEAKATFDDLRQYLKLFYDLVAKYILFFTGPSYGKTLQADLAFDPRRVFQHPFIKPSEPSAVRGGDRRQRRFWPRLVELYRQLRRGSRSTR